MPHISNVPAHRWQYWGHRWESTVQNTGPTTPFRYHGTAYFGLKYFGLKYWF